jgi:hypothetical protein
MTDLKTRMQFIGYRGQPFETSFGDLIRGESGDGAKALHGDAAFKPPLEMAGPLSLVHYLTAEEYARYLKLEVGRLAAEGVLTPARADALMKKETGAAN